MSDDKQRREIGVALRKTNFLIKRHIEASPIHRSTVQMTGTHVWVLAWLFDNRDHDVFQRDMEREFGIRRSTATGILQLIEKNGLITREPVASDARLKKLVLTPCALQLHARIARVITATEALLRNGLSQEEIDGLFATLDKIQHNLSEDAPPCGPRAERSK